MKELLRDIPTTVLTMPLGVIALSLTRTRLVVYNPGLLNLNPPPIGDKSDYC